ncbi:DUF2066 domain-containing protein [Glycocaulis abyssi]|uniref:DUF2066 domain-containing protein n=1 Tax=Glycocaulis abyssi TaxID=1433403 RepID=A0ABV9N8F8_9PROT
MTHLISRTRAAIGALLTAILCVAFLAAPASTQDVFTVSGIGVDERAGTTTEAQAAAFRAGQIAAAQALLERLTLGEDRISAGLTSIPADAAQEMVAGLEVSGERRSANRYIATLTVNFDARSVRNYLRGQNIAFVESQAARTLVVPVIERDGNVGLWGGAWYEAWRSGPHANALTPHIGLGSLMSGEGDDAVPVGRNVISASAAQSGDEFALRELAALYGVSRVAVITAREGEGIIRASGTVYDFSGPDTAVSDLASAASQSGYDELARRIVQTAQEAWKREVVVRGGEASEVTVSVLYSSMAQWRSLQRAITGASLISNARLDAVTTTGAVMTITHRGERDQLVRELAQRGARLEEERGLGWVARPRN